MRPSLSTTSLFVCVHVSLGRCSLPDWARRTACGGQLMHNAIEIEELGCAQYCLYWAFSLVLDIGIFQDHNDQGKRHV